MESVDSFIRLLSYIIPEETREVGVTGAAGEGVATVGAGEVVEGVGDAATGATGVVGVGVTVGVVVAGT